MTWTTRRLHTEVRTRNTIYKFYANDDHWQLTRLNRETGRMLPGVYTVREKPALIEGGDRAGGMLVVSDELVFRTSTVEGGALPAFDVPVR